MKSLLLAGCKLLVFSFAFFAASCSGGDTVTAEQAELYTRYSDSLKGANDYARLKQLNNGLNKDIAALIKERGDDVVEEYGNGKFSADVKRLQEAEKRYVLEYIGKMLPKVFEKQTGLYNEYALKIKAAVDYRNALDLHRKFKVEFDSIQKENSWEFKKMALFKDAASSSAALQNAAKSYNAAYAERFAPEVVGMKTALYNDAYGHLGAAEGYEALKEQKVMLDKRLSIIDRDNESFAKDLNNPLYVDSAVVAELAQAQEKYMDSYMVKMAPCLLAQNKLLYENAIKILGTVKSLDDLKAVARHFPNADRLFTEKHSQELAWIEKHGSEYKAAIDEIRQLQERLNNYSNEKYNELKNK